MDTAGMVMSTPEDPVVSSKATLHSSLETEKGSSRLPDMQRPRELPCSLQFSLLSSSVWGQPGAQDTKGCSAHGLLSASWCRGG